MNSNTRMKTSYGFAKARLIRRIVLPEFNSVKELALKLAVMEEGMT